MYGQAQSPFHIAPFWSDSLRLEVACSSMLINLLSLALPLSLLQVYDRVIPNQSFGTITLLIIGTGVAICLEALMRFARAHVMGTVGARFEQNAGMAALSHILSADISSFEREPSITHVERFNSLLMLREYYGGQILVTLIDIPFVFLFIGLVCYFGGELGLILGALIAIFFILAIVLGKRLATATDKFHEANEDRMDGIVGALSGITSLKAQAMEPSSERKFEMLSLRTEEMGQRVHSRTGQLVDLSFLMSQLAIISMVSYGAVLVTEGNLSLGGLAACTLLAGRTMQPLTNVVGFWTKFQSIRNARKRFREIFSIPLATQLMDTSNRNIADEIRPVKAPGSISLTVVRFRFDDSSEDLLRDVNLEIKCGECIAITGPNGSGKSVLLSLIRGFATPTGGRLMIDDKQLSDWDAASLDKVIYYLPQRETVFTGTILENITTFRPEREYQAPAAAKIVGLADWIQQQPAGYQLRVGSGSNERLPRGIAQRVALARCLVNDPKILLFDDANSAIDQVGDASVKTMLTTLKTHCTIILVSHRPSILELADRIFYLADKTLVQDVPHVRDHATMTKGNADG